MESLDAYLKSTISLFHQGNIQTLRAFYAKLKSEQVYCDVYNEKDELLLTTKGLNTQRVDALGGNLFYHMELTLTIPKEVITEYLKTGEKITGGFIHIIIDGEEPETFLVQKFNVEGGITKPVTLDFVIKIDYETGLFTQMDLIKTGEIEDDSDEFMETEFMSDESETFFNESELDESME